MKLNTAHFHFRSRNRHPRHDWWLNVAEVYGVTAAQMSSISTTSVFSPYWRLSHHTQFQAKNKTTECVFPLYLIDLSRPFHFILDGDALVQQLDSSCHFGHSNSGIGCAFVRAVYKDSFTVLRCYNRETCYQDCASLSELCGGVHFAITNALLAEFIKCD